MLNPFQEDSDSNGIGDAYQTLPTCSDGVDNDADGLVDFPSDGGCADAADTTETDITKACDDGIDNDADALSDFNTTGTRDPGCGRYQLFALSENPECDNGIDDDLDGFIDWDGNFGLSAPDPECQGFGFGTSETVPEPGMGISLALGGLFLIGLRNNFFS